MGSARADFCGDRPSMAVPSVLRCDSVEGQTSGRRAYFIGRVRNLLRGTNYARWGE